MSMTLVRTTFKGKQAPLLSFRFPRSTVSRARSFISFLFFSFLPRFIRNWWQSCSTAFDKLKHASFRPLRCLTIYDCISRSSRLNAATYFGNGGHPRALTLARTCMAPPLAKKYANRRKIPGISLFRWKHFDLVVYRLPRFLRWMINVERWLSVLWPSAITLGGET